MHQINLNDQVYLEAQRRAAEQGFETVDDYVADVLQQEFCFEAETPNLDHLFTPEVLEAIDRADAQIAAGQYYTREGSDRELQGRREEWLKARKSS